MIVLLSEAIEQNKIAPAYLFSSQVEGVGKGKTALAIAGENNHLDILQIKPTHPENSENASQQKGIPAIRVEQVREAIEFLSTSAVKAKQKGLSTKQICSTLPPPTNFSRRWKNQKLEHLS